ncbi:MAG: hypothetical protein U9N00_00515 [Candidatus Bipolaricaulota bacterium]|nr:hypothetical protein [Candidatus Bipolaricaulota bacterium]
MPRIYSRFMFLLMLIVLLTTGGLALADDVCCPDGPGLGFSGSVGLEFTFTPIPPLSYNIESGLTLSFSVAGFTFESETVFDLSGFQAQGFVATVDLGAAQISEEILFDPYFRWNQLGVDAQFLEVQAGLDLILANIGSVQTPDYSMGAVLELSSGILCGFSITTLTGFGAVDLVNILDGIEAPFSHDLLGLFIHLDSMFGVAPDLRVTIVPGFYFEEELVRLEMDYAGLIASSSTWFDLFGFSQEIIEFGYRFEEPTLAFLTAVSFDDTISISGLNFILDLQIEMVRFTAETSFVAPTTPTSIPIVFDGQSFAISVDICGVILTSETDFDETFLFERQLIALEATIDPVHFASLTSFDGSGFSGQWLRADVAFGGITLYTTAAFDYSGINEVSFGFELTF